jgi:hypothetical protein
MFDAQQRCAFDEAGHQGEVGEPEDGQFVVFGKQSFERHESLVAPKTESLFFRLLLACAVEAEEIHDRE